MVMAAIGTPTIMFASMCLLVSIGMSWIMSIVLVIMSRLSTSLMFVVERGTGDDDVMFSGVDVVVVVVIVVVYDSVFAKYGNIWLR